MFCINAITYLHVKITLQDLRKTSIILHFNAICSATPEHSGRILIYAEIIFYILLFMLDSEFEKFQIRNFLKAQTK